MKYIIPHYNCLQMCKKVAYIHHLFLYVYTSLTVFIRKDAAPRLVATLELTPRLRSSREIVVTLE